LGTDDRTNTEARPHFEYVRPESLDELLAIMRAHPDARLLAGGTDLLVRLRKGAELPRMVVDLKRVADLPADIAPAGDVIRIGARTVITEVVGDRSLREHFPALVESALVVGSVQIRNRATIAGNICNASPAADTAPALLAYGASVNVIGTTGLRAVPLDQLFAGPGRTVLAPGEIVHSIDLPLPKGRTGGAFGRLSRRHGVDLAIVNLCCVVRETGEARFAFGAVGPRPFSVNTRLDAAVEGLLSHASPISDLRASAEYRMAMLPVLARRVLKTAVSRMRQPERPS